LFDAKKNPDKEQTGWAISPDAPEEIAEAVQDILRNSEKVEKVKKTASEMVRMKYDWEIVARDMRGIFSRLVGGV
jgi:glycosyltransferase involved in cell wall biosynthesis